MLKLSLIYEAEPVKDNSEHTKKPQSKKRKFPLFRILFFAAGMVAFALIFTLVTYYSHYSGMIDDRLSGKMSQGESKIFTAPKRISVGQALSRDKLVAYLKAVGYSSYSSPEAAGQIILSNSAVEIHPSANSYFAGKNAVSVDFARERISMLRSLDSGDRVLSVEIEPELISGLFGSDREKRRVLSYAELPQILLKAVLCAEDKRFFEHPGFDPIRILGAAWADLRYGGKAQGASTITMQVARSFFFTTKREWRRKVKETYMAMILEHRFTKERIFELYANEVYLGNRGSFAIHGFGEASQAYFGKDLRELNLSQTCFLAGIIRAPNRYSAAERKPERAAEARDRVLSMMAANGYLTEKEVEQAKKEPLQIVRGAFGASLAGHFVDMVKEDLLEKYSETDLNALNYRIYTTLDSDLQRAAMNAVDWGLKNVDTQLEKTYAAWRKRGQEVPAPQVALVALDPATGEIKALVGGRDYAQSQLNHALTNRQPGSVFKPFVYAAAFENALNDTEPILTPISTVVDEPTTFYYDEKEYTPNNYGQEFHGIVTLREALKRSLNVATVKVAQEAGYEHVVNVAKRAGMNSNIRPTPALALGAYETTPLEVAKSYTVFANYGTRSEPLYLKRVVNHEGVVLQNNPLHRKESLDPRVAYLITNLMEDVINHGTGAGVRSRGFYAPAAGKTGTSHDGWFAGFTTNLVCVVWVGFDDNRELRLSGANSAGPIWGEFMKRAVLLPGFSNAQPFERPEGVVAVTIDAESRLLARPECPEVREEVFIAGTEPTEYCKLHGTGAIEKAP
jgi:penicillin-binding protein 1B